MLDCLDGLRELTFGSLVLRLTLAVVFGGLIGMDRGRKRRPAGFRTYLLVCMGAALTMLLGQYFQKMAPVWGLMRLDVGRLGAQVISGIGFLGAGTIIVTEYLQVRGLTTAAGLWASACMGLAIGAGFYECVFLAFLLIFGVMRLLPYVESYILSHTRTMTLYVEVFTPEDLSRLLSRVKAQEAEVQEVRFDRGRRSDELLPNAIFTLHLPKNVSHERMLAAIGAQESVCVVKEL